MKLQTYKDYTIDYRLKQFRSCEGRWDSFGKIDFIPFDSDKGKKILKALREKKELDRLGLSTLRKK